MDNYALLYSTYQTEKKENPTEMSNKLILNSAYELYIF